MRLLRDDPGPEAPAPSPVAAPGLAPGQPGQGDARAAPGGHGGHAGLCHRPQLGPQASPVLLALQESPVGHQRQDDRLRHAKGSSIGGSTESTARIRWNTRSASRPTSTSPPAPGPRRGPLHQPRRPAVGRQHRGLVPAARWSTRRAPTAAPSTIASASTSTPPTAAPSSTTSTSKMCGAPALTSAPPPPSTPTRTSPSSPAISATPSPRPRRRPIAAPVASSGPLFNTPRPLTAAPHARVARNARVVGTSATPPSPPATGAPSRSSATPALGLVLPHLHPLRR